MRLGPCVPLQGNRLARLNGDGGLARRGGAVADDIWRAGGIRLDEAKVLLGRGPAGEVGWVGHVPVGGGVVVRVDGRADGDGFDEAVGGDERGAREEEEELHREIDEEIGSLELRLSVLARLGCFPCWGTGDEGAFLYTWDYEKRGSRLTSTTLAVARRTLETSRSWSRKSTRYSNASTKSIAWKDR